MSKIKILIVEDMEGTLKVYTKELEKTDYEVFGALTCKDALEIAQREKPDIVFTDLVVPGMNGVEICKTIKEDNPSTEIVMISSYFEGATQLKEDFVKAGGRQEWLTKPIKPGQLIETIREILKEKGQE